MRVVQCSSFKNDVISAALRYRLLYEDSRRGLAKFYSLLRGPMLCCKCTIHLVTVCNWSAIFLFKSYCFNVDVCNVVLAILYKLGSINTINYKYPMNVSTYQTNGSYSFIGNE